MCSFRIKWMCDHHWYHFLIFSCYFFYLCFISYSNLFVCLFFYFFFKWVFFCSSSSTSISYLKYIKWPNNVFFFTWIHQSSRSKSEDNSRLSRQTISKTHKSTCRMEWKMSAIHSVEYGSMIIIIPYIGRSPFFSLWPLKKSISL